jgi:hypothetical protein
MCGSLEHMGLRGSISKGMQKPMTVDTLPMRATFFLSLIVAWYLAALGCEINM